MLPFRRSLASLACASAALLFLAGCGTPGAPVPSRSVKIGPKPASAKPDTLPAWIDKTPSKLALLSFVERTTTRGSADYIPPAERVAVVSASLFPVAGRSATPAPLRELLSFLTEGGYRVYLVTDGDPEPLRIFARDQLDFPPERALGSYPEADYIVRDGRPQIVPRSGQARVAKPVIIQRFVGRRPVLAFGADAADLQMLEYATLANPRPNAAFVVPASSSSRAELGETARSRAWVVVDPANDWIGTTTR